MTSDNHQDELMELSGTDSVTEALLDSLIAGACTSTFVLCVMATLVVGAIVGWFSGKYAQYNFDNCMHVRLTWTAELDKTGLRMIDAEVIGGMWHWTGRFQEPRVIHSERIRQIHISDRFKSRVSTAGHEEGGGEL